jgi:hypothetical protein
MAICENCNQKAKLKGPDGTSVLLGILIIVAPLMWIGVPLLARSSDASRAFYFQEQIRLAKCRPVNRWLDGEVVSDKTCILPDGTVLSTR